MATDPRKLRPAELCRMLNSTPLGEVVSERQLLRHRNRAGLRIGEGSTVDLLRYAAWLVQERHRPKPVPEVDPYEKIKERARARAAALAQAGRDIGQLPAVANPDRKGQASEDFRFFCESYFPLSFSLAWSPDHLKVIGKVEQAVLRGGLFAMAMPRGSGKSTICEIACIWTLLYGDHPRTLSFFWTAGFLDRAVTGPLKRKYRPVIPQSSPLGPALEVRHSDNSLFLVFGAFSGGCAGSWPRGSKALGGKLA
ncbi:MAG: hypothetical protein U0795_19930 [Pirellulales bacterium]